MLLIPGEMEEVKQDLSSFRFEMMNELESQKKDIESAILQVTVFEHVNNFKKFLGELFVAMTLFKVACIILYHSC